MENLSRPSSVSTRLAIPYTPTVFQRYSHLEADWDFVMQARYHHELFDAKTATNSHTSTFAQVVCAEFFNRGLFSSQLKKLCEIHRERRDVMMNCFAKYMPDGTKWVHPDGGLFSWVELPGGIDTAALLPEANAPVSTT